MMQAALVRVRRTAAAEAAWARVIVALLPLLGLLGTVTGMIESFETLSAAGGSDPGGLTGGISAALLTTLAGLVTALPGVFAVHRLERRTDRLADKVRARLRRFMRPSCCRS
jgi:biopolymer transport protein ExbB